MRTFLSKFKKSFSIKIKKKFPWLVISGTTAVVVFLSILCLSIAIPSAIAYYKKTNAYKDQLALFYVKDCDHCTKVDTYIANNNIRVQLSFTTLEVFENNDNYAILLDKAKNCGLLIEDIGVPFLWDGPHKKCIMGDVNIINFFQEAVKK